MKVHLRQTSSTARRIAPCAPALIGSILIGAMSAFAPLHAADTEVFFGQADPNDNIHPNVLFVLDTSGSMGDVDSGFTTSRLQRMKDAMTTILDRTTNVNVGLMSFNSYYGGGPVLYPVSPIDKVSCPNNNCGAVTVASRVSQAQDDVEEYMSDGSKDIIGNILSMGTANNRGDQIVGLRFDKLSIPQGATITDATIEFEAYDTNSTSLDVSIQVEDRGDTQSFDLRQDGDLLNRPRSTAAVSWQPATWLKGQKYITPNLSSVVQTAISRSDWCGENALTVMVTPRKGSTGSRNAISYEKSTTVAPILRVTYDSTTIPRNGGCMAKIANAQVSAAGDDAVEYNNRARRVYTNTQNIRVPRRKPQSKAQVRNTAGLRFANVAIPENATITSAFLDLMLAEVRTGSVSMTIQGEAADDSAAFRGGATGDLTGRTKTAAFATWTLNDSDGTALGTRVRSGDLKDIVQEVVSRSGWSNDNALSLMISSANDSQTSLRAFETYEGKPSEAATLRVAYTVNVGPLAGTGQANISARDDLKTVVNNLNAYGGTPIVSTYYEAASYMLGKPVDYGRTRGAGNQRSGLYRVSHPDSYTGGTVTTHPFCLPDYPDSVYCRYEEITGDAKYISPMSASCQTNHIVFLSDGEPNSNTAIDKIKSLTGVSDCDSTNTQQKCGVELASWLNDTDHNASVPRKQNITTYTVGFNIKSDFLKSLSTAGGGNYYPASSSADLIDVFQRILGNVNAVDTSFVAPGATVNQFNRLTHRDDIYFAVFKPDTQPTWSGNLKQYYVRSRNGKVQIEGAKKGESVIDKDSGYFADGAKSVWSDVTDGPDVALGGAASRLSLNHFNGGKRKVYTYMGNYDALGTAGKLIASSGNALHESNRSISESDLKLDQSGTLLEREARRTELLKWARGIDVNDEDLDNDEEDIRHHMGDPMHSRPVIVNYAGAGNPSTVFVATNEGYLHAINAGDGTDGGKELYAFVPKELLGNLNTFFRNEAASVNDRPYGLDGDMAVWHDDKNDNIIVDSGEKAYLYVGMRRGGRNYYAFDISDRLNPKLAWVIEGGKGGFEELGETWSRPVPTKMVINKKLEEVLIFGGGYDKSKDLATSANAEDTVGRAIYVVNAKTGALLWSVRNDSDNTGSTPSNVQDFASTGMKYSIPSDIRVIDINADGRADQLYVGDTGGQIWRFDVMLAHERGEDLFKGGVMADLSGTLAKDARKFYYEPDVALIAKQGYRFLSISVGSGWRAHPLDEVINDRFYSLRSTAIYDPPAGYGKNTGTAASPVWKPLTEADLEDITDDVTPDANANGWYLKLEADGEKVLGDSLTANNQVVFTSYEPVASGDPCSPAIGGGSLYIIDVLNGAPTKNLDGKDAGAAGATSDNTTAGGLSLSDRKKPLQHGGIPPEATLLLVEETGGIGNNSTGTSELPTGETASATGVQPALTIATEIQEFDIDNLTPRSYWQDLGKVKPTASATID